MTPMPFQSVLLQARRKDPEALSYLYLQFLPIISNYVSRRAPADYIEDITQDVFFKMVHDIHKLRAKDELSFRAWLFAIAAATIARYHHKAGNYHKTGIVRIVPLEAASDIISPDDPTQQLEAQDDLNAVIEMMRKLSTEKRHIVMSRAQGKNFSVIAAHHGKSVPATRQTHSRIVLSMKRATQLIVIIFFSLVLVCSYIFVSNSRPGSLLYPVKQIVQPVPSAPTDTPRPIWTPSPRPTPSPTPSPRPMPTPRPTPQATPAPAPATTAPQQNNSLLPVKVPLRKQLCDQGVCL